MTGWLIKWSSSCLLFDRSNILHPWENVERHGDYDLDSKHENVMNGLG